MANGLTVLPSEFAKYVTDVEIGPAGAADASRVPSLAELRAARTRVASSRSPSKANGLTQACGASVRGGGCLR